MRQDVTFQWWVYKKPCIFLSAFHPAKNSPIKAAKAVISLIYECAFKQIACYFRDAEEQESDRSEKMMEDRFVFVGMCA